MFDHDERTDLVRRGRAVSTCHPRPSTSLPDTLHGVFGTSSLVNGPERGHAEPLWLGTVGNGRRGRIVPVSTVQDGESRRQENRWSRRKEGRSRPGGDRPRTGRWVDRSDEEQTGSQARSQKVDGEWGAGTCTPREGDGRAPRSREHTGVRAGTRLDRTASTVHQKSYRWCGRTASTTVVYDHRYFVGQEG